MVDLAQARLTVQGGPDSGTTIPLSGRPLMLGRRSDNDVVVDENWVSRQHALIIETSTGFALRDLNTTNGTFVNGGRIGPAEHLLNHGDSIRLAGSQVSFIFREEGGGYSTPGGGLARHGSDGHCGARARAAGPSA